MSIGSELMISEGATLAAAMTDLASGDWRWAPDPGPLGWACPPAFADVARKTVRTVLNEVEGLGAGLLLELPEN